MCNTIKNEKRTCVDCKREFTLKGEEISWFESMNLELPKRCKTCRKRRKAERRKAEREDAE